MHAAKVQISDIS